MTQARCPICSKPAEAKFTPFCSRRCADVDLSRWLKGGYAIPGRPAVDEDEAEGPGAAKSQQNRAPGDQE
jgi:endogenous inhibitor of DNA gyrase (YacG/DUF329 family)